MIPPVKSLPSTPADRVFRLFIQLRGLAAAAQFVLGAYCILKLRLELPWSILGTVSIYLFITNLLLGIQRHRFQALSPSIIPSLLFLDTLMLTLMLYVSGGLQNPFLVVYILHIVTSALLLPPRTTSLLLLFTGISMTVLSFSPYPLYSPNAFPQPGGSHLHIRGILLAQLGVAAGIGWFVYQLRRDVEQSRDQIRKQAEQLERAHHFQALATFASGLAHELATPLGTIAVVSAEMDRKACTRCHQTECSQDARLIRNEVERCKSILERLRLTDAQDTRLEPVLIHLSRLPDELPAHLASAHAARIHWNIPPHPPTPTLPALGLFQALSTLIKNACEADPSGKPVTISLHETRHTLHIRVQDQGHGIDADTLSKLGEPFFTTKQPGFGTGLGLFLVRTFLDQVGGELSVQSRPGAGSRFEMIIPLP